MANFDHSMGAQTNPQLQLNLRHLPTRKHKMNAVDITLEQNAFMFGDNQYDFLNSFINLLANPKISYEDTGDEDEKRKIIIFLRDTKYDVGVGEKRSNTYKTNKHIIEARRNRYLVRGLIDHNNQRSCHVNGLVERL